MSITEQALATVKDRQGERGSGVGTAERWAKIFEAITGHPVTSEDYAWAGLAMKLAREGERPKKNPDNLVDTVGYIEVLDRIRTAYRKSNEDQTIEQLRQHVEGRIRD